jgi:hypothetical protein
MDNIFLVEESIAWATESQQDLAVILIDFEKAFDRVNWTFLQEAMKKMGYDQDFIKWTVAVYKSSTSQIIVNGAISREFPLDRAVRQGYPLAPYLYIIFADVLGYLLNILGYLQYGIRGLRLPNGKSSIEQLFADDTNLYVQGTPENLDRVMRVLTLFCKASGSKIKLDQNTPYLGI